ncbi:MAG: hypothetical protein E7619_03885 [Ruminococcaceae bacterium]|nr:hypothetical protein [Oscillospiraceae bacterium]
MNYSFAGLTVDMEPKFEMLGSRAEKYRSGEVEADITIRIPDKVFSDFCEENPHLTPAECEYLIAGSAFYHHLVDFGGIMLHSSAVAYKGEAYLFSANSGTGKSTHTSLWLKEFGEDAVIINDDKPALRIIDGKIMCCGTPFSGKHDISENRLYPVKGIAFITRGEKNSIMPIPPSVSLPLFMEQTVRSFGMARADRFLALLSEILTRVPVHSLTCNMDPEAAHVALKGMQ